MLTETEEALVFQGLIRAEQFAELMNPGWYVWNGTRVTFEHEGMNYVRTYLSWPPMTRFESEICVRATFLHHGLRFSVESWGICNR